MPEHIYCNKKSGAAQKASIVIEKWSGPFLNSLVSGLDSWVWVWVYLAHFLPCQLTRPLLWTRDAGNRWVLSLKLIVASFLLVGALFNSVTPWWNSHFTTWPPLALVLLSSDLKLQLVSYSLTLTSSILLLLRDILLLTSLIRKGSQAHLIYLLLLYLSSGD